MNIEKIDRILKIIAFSSLIGAALFGIACVWLSIPKDVSFKIFITFLILFALASLMAFILDSYD